MIFTESDLPDEIPFYNDSADYFFVLIKRSDGYHLKNDIYKQWPHTKFYSILEQLNIGRSRETFHWWNKGIDNLRKQLIFKKQMSEIAEGKDEI